MSEAPPAGDGAALQDIALVGGIITIATLGTLAVVVAYRTGRGAPLRVLETVAEAVLRVPGWAAIPGLAAIGAAVLTFMGAIWDIGVHIDDGRDEGPFGTPAHYPMLVGLVAVYLTGVLAAGMAPRRRKDGSPAAVSVPGLGAVPVGAVMIVVGGGYAMLGFPLDDLWHRVFGQDVTLWGPTHTMFFGGLICATCGAVILLAEGARARGRDPWGGWALWRRPLPAVLGGIFLFVATHATDEFNWGLPQYRMVWQPLILAFFGALALVAARSLGGRGATVGVLLVYLPLQFLEVGMIGALGTTEPASVLFVAEALLVELVFLRATRELRAGALAGLAVGTVGFAAEYAWTHVAMPLPWQPALLPEAIPTAALAGTAGGLLGALLALALRGGLGDVRRPLQLALGAGAVVVALGVNAGIATQPQTTATISLTNVRDGVADLHVRLSRPELAEDGVWAYVLGWQGGGRHYAHLVRQPDGSLRSSKPVPIGGTWKSFVRIHKGRTLLAAPIRMPADAAVGFEGYPARAEVTRPMIADTELLQTERKDDGPLWAWTPAMLLVMALNLSLMGVVGWGAARAGRSVHASTGQLA